MSYPLFLPPGDLGEKTAREWSSTEAREFYRWQLAILEERVGNMLTYFDEELTGDAEADLKRLGERVASVVAEPEFSYQAKTEPIIFKKGARALIAPPQTETEPKLTSAGYALGADMGLLLAKLLLEACGDKIRWTILKKRKTGGSYNLPILEGFTEWSDFEPIGLSIAELQATLRGESRPAAWSVMFAYWRNECTGFFGYRGFRVRLKGESGIICTEGRTRRMTVNSDNMFEGTYHVHIHADRIPRWDSPHEREPLSAAEWHRIIENVRGSLERAHCKVSVD